MTTIRFDPPLPCGALRDHGDGKLRRCGRPATAGTVDPLGVQWLLLPICRECTTAMAANYGVGGEQEEGATDER